MVKRLEPKAPCRIEDVHGNPIRMAELIATLVPSIGKARGLQSQLSIKDETTQLAALRTGKLEVDQAIEDGITELFSSRMRIQRRWLPPWRRRATRRLPPPTTRAPPSRSNW